ncbi:hypothetical protein CTAYLR_004877 [Chrysophaeum taylorii]|uniref:Uncharacterized protein n=1 Tax=Chrysophaeum taylorii TaxID=2483200 RepID=A0AAD7XM65_9STRA|nr:hypothetical protein CTAYLR_004877 [Chrysophaeum taylorii]
MIAAVLVSLLAAAQGYGGTFARRLTSVEEVAKLSASDESAFDSLGTTVAIFGDTIVVGAYGDNDENSNEGAAYVFSATTYAQVAKLVASDGDSSDEFGNAVAIYEETIVVGARYDDDRGINAGAAYVFSSKTYGQLAKLTASDGSEYDYFGWSVAIFDRTIVVGSIFDDGKYENAGAVYVFDASTYAQLCKLTASDGGDSDYFGYAVAIFNNTIVVGSSRDDDVDFDAGAVYVFERCVQVAKLTASDANREARLGETVAIFDDTIVAGARYADVDDVNNEGAAYVFRYSGSAYVQLAKLTASDGGANHWFGRSVAIRGNTIVVGATGR